MASSVAWAGEWCGAAVCEEERSDNLCVTFFSPSASWGAAPQFPVLGVPLGLPQPKEFVL